MCPIRAVGYSEFDPIEDTERSVRIYEHALEEGYSEFDPIGDTERQFVMAMAGLTPPLQRVRSDGSPPVERCREPEFFRPTRQFFETRSTTVI